jgi:hypothetical protein
MTTELINTEIVMAFGSCIGILLIAFLCDRHFRIRRAAALNAAYIARIQANRDSEPLVWPNRRNRTRSFSELINKANLTCNDQVETSGPGFFGRRRTLSDNSGRIVATHYEEIVLTDIRGEREFQSSNRPRLMLAPAGM